MSRLRPTDVALPIIAATGALTLAVVTSAGVLDWLFETILWTALLLAARQAWRERRTAQLARQRAAELQHTSTETTARAAVGAERARLSVDIEVSLRELVGAVGRRAAAALDAADPSADIQWIQARTQQANGELRRQLGLLRAEEPPPSSSPMRAPGLPRLQTADVIVPVLITALAVTEMVTLFPMEGRQVSWLSVVLTVSTAATVLGRRTHPVLAALAASTLMTTGAIVDEPVLDGLWLATTLALLSWTLAARCTRQAWAALGALVVTDLVSRLLNQPENVPINIVIVAVATASGAAVGHLRRRLAVAARAAADRTEELTAATAEAVSAARRQVARELHDLVSHAVSLVAVQAGAAEMLWPTDPRAARGSLRIVVATTEHTVAELDRLQPDAQPVTRTMADVPDLVNRMRAAGLEVTLAVDVAPDPALMSAIYRVVQETLTNAMRYAPSSRVNVSVTRGRAPAATRDEMEESIVIRVVSGGTVASPTDRRGFGLVGLRERVEHVGGTLHIGRQFDPPQFTVTAVLPASRTSAS